MIADGPTSRAKKCDVTRLVRLLVAPAFTFIQFRLHLLYQKYAMAFSSAFRRFASTAASGKQSLYISSFLAVPVTYVVLNDDSFPAALKPSSFLSVSSNAPVDGSQPATTHAWSWPWASSNATSATNTNVTGTANTADAGRVNGKSNKVFVRLSFFIHLSTENPLTS